MYTPLPLNIKECCAYVFFFCAIPTELNLLWQQPAPLKVIIYCGERGESTLVLMEPGYFISAGEGHASITYSSGVTKKVCRRQRHEKKISQGEPRQKHIGKTKMKDHNFTRGMKLIYKASALIISIYFIYLKGNIFIFPAQQYSVYATVIRLKILHTIPLRCCQVFIFVYMIQGYYCHRHFLFCSLKHGLI